MRLPTKMSGPGNCKYEISGRRMNLAENLLERWNLGRQGPMRIGLSGFNSATGLGYQNRDLIDKLPIASWLIIEHPSKPSLEPPPDLPVVISPIIASEDRVQDWLGEIDCLLTEARIEF